MTISTDTVRSLREATGVSVMQCKKALLEADGDLARAREILAEQAGVSASKKGGRALAAGVVGAFVHDGVIGALVLLSAETDFVAKNPEFAALARELALQVSAVDPADDAALLASPFVKDERKTVQDLLNEATQKFGERVSLSAFSRLSAR